MPSLEAEGAGAGEAKLAKAAGKTAAKKRITTTPNDALEITSISAFLYNPEKINSRFRPSSLWTVGIICPEEREVESRRERRKEKLKRERKQWPQEEDRKCIRSN